MRFRPVYRRDGWILAICVHCRRLNYVEPHGTTRTCPGCKTVEAEHDPIPYARRANMAGTYVVCKGDRLEDRP